MDIVQDEDFIEFLGVQESQNITPAVDFKQRVNALRSSGGAMNGLQLPWKKMDDLFALRKKEVTVWAGINGHGKSQLLGQVCALTLPSAKWLVASLEMPVEMTMERMTNQMAGFSNLSDEYSDKLIDTTDGRLWIYDQLDTVPANRILAMIHYAATKLKVDHIILDSLVKCGLGVDDYNAQKKFVDRLCWAAKSLDVGIHLVHHIRKSEREGKVPDKFDIKGAGEITDLVDNVVIIHRNKDKEAKVRDGKPVDKFEPDTSFIVAKQRHAGIESKFALYFDPASQQFKGSPDARTFQVAVD